MLSSPMKYDTLFYCNKSHMGESEELPDEVIAAQVQKGDADLFGVLIARYEAKMLRYARKFVSQHEDMQDAVQDIFIKAYTNIQSFDTSRRFSPWLYRIAHNELVNALKKRGTEKVSFLDLDMLFPHPLAPLATDTEAQVKELRAMLDTCLTKLSPKYREVLILYYFEEMQYHEIADVLEIPVATVGVRLQRGKKALQNIYATHPGNN